MSIYDQINRKENAMSIYDQIIQKENTMSVNDQIIQEFSLANTQFILKRILWNDDTIQFVEEGHTRVVEGLIIATTSTGTAFAFPKIGDVVYPHDIDIHEDGSLAINTATARHDLSKYTCKEVSIKEWGA